MILGKVWVRVVLGLGLHRCMVIVVLQRSRRRRHLLGLWRRRWRSLGGSVHFDVCDRVSLYRIHIKPVAGGREED